MAKELIMTEERFNELQARLDYLKNQGRKENFNSRKEQH